MNRWYEAGAGIAGRRLHRWTGMVWWAVAALLLLLGPAACEKDAGEGEWTVVWGGETIVGGDANADDDLMSPPVGEPDPFLEEAQATVDAFRALYKGLVIPESLLQDHGNEPTKDGTCFDPNTFFQVLDKLQMEPGWALDYTYFYAFDSGGEPTLVARDTTSPPCMTAGEEPCVTEEVWDHLVAQGDKESLLQVLVLRTMGQQFYQDWHYISDTRLVFTQAGLDAWKAEQSQYMESKEKQQFAQATDKLRFQGSATMTEDGLRITFIRVGANSALYEQTVTISPQPPYELKGEPGGSQTLLECFWCYVT